MNRVHSLLVFSLIAAVPLGACSASDEPPTAPGVSGSASQGAGAPAMGGTATAGSAAGGNSAAGSVTGGVAAGGGGAGAGGVAAGGGGASAGTGGAAGATVGGGGGAGGGGAAGAGGTDLGGSLSAGCGKAPTIPNGMYNNGSPIAITAANRQRRYILSVPVDYDNTKPHKLVIAWHQLDGNDKQMYQQSYYWLKDIPEAASSTIFVAPNGEKGGTPCTGMGNGESGCGWPDSNGSNVALADAVVAQIQENFCIDKNKIFANGWSYGGSMSYRTACSRPQGGTSAWGVRAVAVYNGAARLSAGGCSPSKQVAFYASHGTNDGVLGYDDGVAMARTFAGVNTCTWATPTRSTGNHVCTSVAGCQAGYPVEFCSFVGDHTPDPRDGGQRWQPQEVWKFFRQF